MTRERHHPGTLSRERIVEVALDIAEREGPDALSMRRIAAELGTGAMSLYNHLPDKAALLEALAQRVLSEVELPRQAAWPEVTRAWSASLRATLLRHHSLVTIVISANQARPLLSVSQDLVKALSDADLDADEARRVMRVVGRFVAGSVLLDAAALRYRRADREMLDDVFAHGLDALIDGLARKIDCDPPVAP